MALIGTIRNNSWLLIVALGLALAAFVIMDMTSGGPSGGSSNFTLGEVNGEKIPWQDFQKHEQILYSGSQTDVFERREFIWNYYVEKALLEDEADALGLGVSSSEVQELEFGTNISPVVRNRFMNPQTGRVDRQQLNQIKQQIESGQIRQDIARFWSHQRKEVKKQRLQEKLQNLVAKGIYSPNWMVQHNQSAAAEKVNFQYTRIPYDLVDVSAEVEASEIQEYMQEHEKEYRNKDPQRNISYVSFQVEPTGEDSSELKRRIEDLIPRFAEAKNDSQFVSKNYGSYDASYITGEEMSQNVADTLTTLDTGAIYGPYIADGAYKAVKLLDRKVIPDSVRASHIVRQAQNPQQATQARQLLDSLKNLVQTGQKSFDTLAQQYGQDRTATKGGDLGWVGPGNMVKAFNDHIFYYAESDELKIIKTEFGLHLVKVTDRKYPNNTMGFKLAFLKEPIVPSEETQNSMYQDALDFVGEHRTMEELKQTADSLPEIAIQKSGPLGKNAYQIDGLPPGNTSRDIIKWAFQSSTDVGDVSPDVFIIQDEELYFNSQYIIAGLSDILEAGLPTVDAVRSQIEPIIRNRKKADMITEEIEGKSLREITSLYDVTIDTASNVSYASNYIEGMGNEPKVQATAFALQEGQKSNPIRGQAGIYVIQLLSRSTGQAGTDVIATRENMTSTKTQELGTELLDAMKNNATIDDNRYTYY